MPGPELVVWGIRKRGGEVSDVFILVCIVDLWHGKWNERERWTRPRRKEVGAVESGAYAWKTRPDKVIAGHLALALHHCIAMRKEIARLAP